MRYARCMQRGADVYGQTQREITGVCTWQVCGRDLDENLFWAAIKICEQAIKICSVACGNFVKRHKHQMNGADLECADATESIHKAVSIVC